MKTCTKCNATKPASTEHFHLNKNSKDGLCARCKPCKLTDEAEYRKTDKYKKRKTAYDKVYRDKETTRGRAKESQLKRNFGITLWDYERMLEKQGGVCAICGKKESVERYRWLTVDHCHDTGVVRGLLCCNCNRGIGLLGDDPAALRNAAKYLEQYK